MEIKTATILGAKVHSQNGWGIGGHGQIVPLDQPLGGRIFQRRGAVMDMPRLENMR